MQNYFKSFSFLHWNKDKEDETKSNSLVWVPRANGATAEFAVKGGIDSGENVYIARAPHAGGIIPGKLHMGHCHAYVSFGGREILKKEYEVLTAPPDILSWVDTEAPNIPQHAVEGGKDPNGDIYYIGRVSQEGTLTVGKVHHGVCYIPYGGKEHKYSKFEILVRNALARALEA